MLTLAISASGIAGLAVWCAVGVYWALLIWLDMPRLQRTPPQLVALAIVLCLTWPIVAAWAAICMVAAAADDDER